MNKYTVDYYVPKLYYAHCREEIYAKDIKAAKIKAQQKDVGDMEFEEDWGNIPETDSTRQIDVEVCQICKKCEEEVVIEQSKKGLCEKCYEEGLILKLANIPVAERLIEENISDEYKNCACHHCVVEDEEDWQNDECICPDQKNCCGCADEDGCCCEEEEEFEEEEE